MINEETKHDCDEIIDEAEDTLVCENCGTVHEGDCPGKSPDRRTGGR